MVQGGDTADGARMTCLAHVTTLAAISVHALCDHTREVISQGLTITHAEADALGDETLDWVRNRLDCEVEETPEGTTIHPAKTGCECGEILGHACAGIAPPEATVEFMPLNLRASHEAAGNRGNYPHNGAMRLRVSSDCMEHVVDGDWATAV